MARFYILHINFTGHKHKLYWEAMLLINCWPTWLYPVSACPHPEFWAALAHCTSPDHVLTALTAVSGSEGLVVPLCEDNMALRSKGSGQLWALSCSYSLTPTPGRSAG